MQGLKRFKDSYDVIVAGGGLGGLGAALRLALNGVEVLVLEQHNMIGGYATSFIRGIRVRGSLHALCEFGEGDVENWPGARRFPTGAGWARRFIEDECGMDWDLVRTPHSYRCCLSDYGIDVTVNFGGQALSTRSRAFHPATARRWSGILTSAGNGGRPGGLESMPKIDKMKILTKHSAFVRVAGTACTT
jgi:prolycopene isomerase